MDNLHKKQSDKNGSGDFKNSDINKAIPEFALNEFPEGATDEFDINDLPPASRRKFLAMLGASAAFLMTGCTDYRDKGKVIPYNDKPERTIVGNPNYYASTLVHQGESYGVLIKTREGRPIKIDGNPGHPVNKGKISPQLQSSIMSLYDPERIEQPKKKEGDSFKPVNWKDVDNIALTQLSGLANAGKEIAIISNTISSPSYKSVLNDFAKTFPTAKVYSYELFDDSTKHSAWTKCYGENYFPNIKWGNPDVLLLLESDVLGNEGNVMEQTREIMSRRDAGNPAGFNRIYCAEGVMSLTGMNSDYRFRLVPEKQLEFVLSLLSELSNQNKISLGSPAAAQVSGYSLEKFAAENGIDKKKLSALVEDLGDSSKKRFVHSGPKLPESVQIAVNLLNEALGAQSMYDTAHKPVVLQQLAGYKEIEGLVSKLNSGAVGAVLIVDSNPVYHFPKDLGFDEALAKAPLKIALVENENETSLFADYLAPINDPLESWGDYQTREGIISLQQPVIEPLYKLHNEVGTRQKEAVLLNWANGGKTENPDKDYFNYMKGRWAVEVYPKFNAGAGFKNFWNSCLHDGVIQFDQKIFDKAATPVELVKPNDNGEAITFTNGSNNGAVNAPKFNYSAFAGLKPSEKNGFTVILHNNYTVYDGKYGNNGWLYELPHPVTKAAWDNYAAMARATADKMGLKKDDMVEIELNGSKLKLPVMPQPGMPEETVAVELGYGRAHAGSIGNGVGFNANIFLSKNGGLSKWIYNGAKVKPANDSYEVVTTQEHHRLDDEFVKDFHRIRDIIQEGTVENYIKHPNFLHEKEHKLLSLYPEHEYPGIKWAMAIDMNKCTSCNACTASCNVENNIPIVGKEQTQKGREMHWIRLDRYYSGTAEEPVVSMQPMLCQHCDNAPCENVCPVSATNHSPDGLNQMAYNRCVGTRYCANNCPYKVRRFNFHDFRSWLREEYQYKDSMQLMNNPEVSVRPVGVMEKCTFCVQRIMDSKKEAVKDGREIKGSDVVTACQEACPSDAIIFGDMNDPDSDITKMRNHDLAYHVLEALNTKPNVTYLAKLRNIKTEETHSEH